MAKSIDPAILKALREEKGWSLDELSKRAKVHRQTIYRLEHGRKRRTRQSTIEVLSKALGVSEAELVGETPRERQRPVADEKNERHQVNVRMFPAARNALSLVATRYKISALQIVELAPFLFFLAAERSLQRRQEFLTRMQSAIEQLENCPTQPHLPAGAVSVGWQDALMTEQESINAKDLFGRIVDESGAMIAPSAWQYDSTEHNPFVAFLKEETAKLKSDAEFESMHDLVGPHYRVGAEEAAAIVGGDPEAIEAVLGGVAPLHEIRKDLGNESTPEQRAVWAKQKAADRARQMGLGESDLILELLNEAQLKTSTEESRS